MIDYPKAIKKLKKNLDMSDSSLGKMLGVSSNSIWHWTSGRTTPKGANKANVDKELVKNSIVTQEELDGAEPAAAKPKKRRGRPGRKSSKETGVSADKNLLKTYYVQLAAEKKINKFHVEIQGINKTHVRDLTPEKWAEFMTLLEDF